LNRFSKKIISTGVATSILFIFIIECGYNDDFD
jgi:hypothetical protein